MFDLLTDVNDDALLDLNIRGDDRDDAQVATLDQSFPPVTSGPGTAYIDPDTAEVIYQPDGTELEGDNISITYQLIGPNGVTELGLIMFRYEAEIAEDADAEVLEETDDLTDETMLTITRFADPVVDGTEPELQQNAAEASPHYADILPLTSVVPETGAMDNEDNEFEFIIGL